MERIKTESKKLCKKEMQISWPENIIKKRRLRKFEEEAPENLHTLKRSTRKDSRIIYILCVLCI